MIPEISAVILTLNEEQNIQNALRSLAPWVSEIVLVDMQSDDRTVEIARAFGAKVFSHPRVGLQDPARAFAMSKASGDWIINLDADEIVPFELSRKLLRVAEEDRADVCLIPRLNYISGSPLLHGGWNPEGDRQVRFFRAGSVAFAPWVHKKPEPVAGSRVIALPWLPGNAIIHFNYLNAEHFLQKLNHYTDIEANQARERGESGSLCRSLFRSIAEFVKRYCLLQGFRDGASGFYYCFLMLVYRLTIGVKLRELECCGSSEEARAKYQSIAESELRKYVSGDSCGVTSVSGAHVGDRPGGEKVVE